MEFEEIRIEIEKWRGQSPYCYWTIESTRNPDERRSAHDINGENTKYWHCWEADAVIIAQELEKWFKNKGMKHTSHREPNPTHVYIY